jgi:hypothetical protein
MRSINGLYGNIATAIAGERGEFLAVVVNIGDVASTKLKCVPLATINDITWLTAKNIDIETIIISNTDWFSASTPLSEANMDIMARQGNTRCISSLFAVNSSPAFSALHLGRELFKQDRKQYRDQRGYYNPR